MNKTYCYTLDRTYQRVMNLLDESQPLMVGLGGVSPWDVETAPPAAKPTLTTIPEIFAYFPITLRKGARRSRNATAETINMNGRIYQTFDVSTIQDARGHDIEKVYLEATIKHNLLTQPSFRIIGFFTNVTFYTGVDTTKEVFLPNDLHGTLVYTENIRAVVQQTNMVQRFRLVIAA